MIQSIHTFTYIKLGSYYRPIIPIALKEGNEIIDFPALVDSGSDFNVFPGFLADFLGINLTQVKQKQITGLSGSATSYPYALEVGIAGKFYRAPLVFSYDTTLNNFGLLGQVGFFDRFVVEFDQRNKVITLK